MSVVRLARLSSTVQLTVGIARLVAGSLTVVGVAGLAVVLITGCLMVVCGAGSGMVSGIVLGIRLTHRWSVLAATGPPVLDPSTPVVRLVGKRAHALALWLVGARARGLVLWLVDARVRGLGVGLIGRRAQVLVLRLVGRCALVLVLVLVLVLWLVGERPLAVVMRLGGMHALILAAGPFDRPGIGPAAMPAVVPGTAARHLTVTRLGIGQATADRAQVRRVAVDRAEVVCVIARRAEIGRATADWAEAVHVTASRAEVGRFAAERAEVASVALTRAEAGHVVAPRAEPARATDGRAEAGSPTCPTSRPTANPPGAVPRECGWGRMGDLAGGRDENHWSRLRSRRPAGITPGFDFRSPSSTAYNITIAVSEQRQGREHSTAPMS